MMPEISSTRSKENLTMNRRDFLRLSALFTATGSFPLLQACERKEARGTTEKALKIGYLPIADSAPLLVAHHQGLFEETGVHVEKPVLFRNWASLVEAFFSGEVNVVHILSPMAVWARFSSRAPVKCVAWNHIDGSALTVANNINSLTDLAGKTLAIPFWYSIHNILLQSLLTDAGLQATDKENPDANEVRIVVMPPSDMLSALANNAISGYIVAEPFNAAAEIKQVGKIMRFTGDIWKHHACCVVLMKENDIKEHPQWTQNVIDSLVKAQIWIKNNRLETAHILSKNSTNAYTPHDEKILQKVFSPSGEDLAHYGHNHSISGDTKEWQRIDFQPYPFVSYYEELIARLQNTYLPNDTAFLRQLNPAQAASDLVDDAFVRRAIIQHNAQQLFDIPEGWTRKEEIVLK